MALEELWYFKYLLAVVYRAISDHLLRTLSHHMLVTDGHKPMLGRMLSGDRQRRCAHEAL